MIKTVEIFFNDLRIEAQANILRQFITTAEEENWDVFPIAILEREVADEEGN